MSRKRKIDFDSSSINKLKKAVCQRFGKNVSDKKTCEELHFSILKNTGQMISVNTLRRFFGIAEANKHQTSLITINILSNYCHYKDFQHFVTGNETSYFNISSSVFLNFVADEKVDLKAFEKAISQLYGYPELYVFLEKCLLLAEQNGDEDFLKNVLRFENCFKVESHNKKNIFDFICLFGKLIEKKFNSPEFDFYAEIINQNKYPFCEFYIDTDNLTGYYGRLIDRINWESPEEIAFYQSLKCFQAFLNNDKISFSSYYILLHPIKSETQKFHPLVQSRILATMVFHDCLFKTDNKSLIIETFKSTIQNFNDKNNAILKIQLFSIFPLLSALWTKKDYLMKAFFQIIPPETFSSLDFWTDNASNHLKIYLAYCKTKSGKTDEAALILKSVELEKFPQFERKQQKISYYLALAEIKQNQQVNCSSELELIEKIKTEKAFSF